MVRAEPTLSSSQVTRAGSMPSPRARGSVAMVSTASHSFSASSPRGAFEMSWFQAASVGRDAARGESEGGGSGNTWQDPRSG